MEIFPAIDLQAGQVVRLVQGNYDKMTVYSADPLQVIKDFKTKGAKNLHIVDLDGAKDGQPVNFPTIAALVAEGGLFIEVGGGIRDEEKIQQYLALGVDRVILGTVAVKNFAFLRQMVAKYGEKIAVGIDAKNGFVAINGWLEVTNIPALDFCRSCRDIGVDSVIFTDIAKDGSMQGANLAIYQMLHRISGLHIIASGGIASENDICELARQGIDGAIIGKALYLKALDLSKIIALAAEVVV